MSHSGLFILQPFGFFTLCILFAQDHAVLKMATNFLNGQ